MKKIFSTLVVIISLLLTVNVFAGDIPESLLSDQAQLFFGEVVDYHPDKENPSIGVSPVKVIKGDIVEGSYRVYNSPWPMGNFTVVPGEIYLFTYYDDVNTTDIFEVTTYDTKTLVTIQSTIRKIVSSRLSFCSCWLLAKEIFKNTFISAS